MALKKLFIPALLAVIFTLQGCATREGVICDSSGLTFRNWYGDTCALEVFLLPVVSLNNTDNTNPINSYGQIIETETGAFNMNLDLGVAAMFNIYKSGGIYINWGLRFTDSTVTGYNYSLSTYRDSNGNMTQRFYNDSLNITYSKNFRASIVFPEIEAPTPFFADLKVIAWLEIAYITWTNTGGTFSDNYSTDEYIGSFSKNYSWNFSSPGKVSNAVFSTNGLTLGAVKLGLVYYYR
jgi:hypothetical protein